MRVFDRQRGQLFCWVPVAFSIGIGGYFALKLEPANADWMVLAAALAGFASLCALVPAVRQWPILIALICAGMGFGVAGARSAIVAAPKLEFRYYGPIEGRIVAIDRSQSDAVRLTLDQVRLVDVAPDKLPARVRVSLHGQQGYLDPRPGLQIGVTGHLAPPAGPVEPGGYDFRRQAWFARIGAVGYARSPALELAPPLPGGPWIWLHGLRYRISGHVIDAIPAPAGGFAAAITTGDRSAIPRANLDDLRATNLAHLLAISGLHMGLLTGVVFGGLRTGLAAIPGLALHRAVRKWAALGALAAGAAYLALSGSNVATERAFVMVAVMLGAILLDRRAITLRAVALAALIVLTLRPESLLSPGFQMSFAATTALVAVYAAMRDRRWEQSAPRAVLWVGGVAFSSLVAGLATAPIAAAHFNQVPHYGLVANVLSVPVMGAVIMPSAVVSAILAPIGLESAGFWIMEQGIRWILTVAEFVAGWPGAVSRVPAPPPWVLPMFALAAVWLVLWQGLWRGAAIPVLAGALAAWSVAERPAVLVAETGGLVGVLTEQGRVLSKARGDGFAARVWLENDGDQRDQAGAAVGWDQVAASSPMRILHATGRGAAERAAAACKAYDLTIVSVGTNAPGCAILDPPRLKDTGAVALYQDQQGQTKIVTVAEKSGQRPWSK